MDSPEIFSLQHETPVPMGRYRTQASHFKTLGSSTTPQCSRAASETILEAGQAKVHSNDDSLSGGASGSLPRPTKQQALLNFGQKRLYSKTCSICGMVYQIGHREDEAMHAKQCRATTDIPSVLIPTACKQLAALDAHWSIFELLPHHCGSHSASVAAVLECLQRDLGMHSVDLSNARKLYVASASRPAVAAVPRSHDIIGAVLVEPVAEAQRAMPLAADEPPPAAPVCPPSAAAAGRQSGALRVYGSARKRSRPDASPVPDVGNTSMVADPSPPQLASQAVQGTQSASSSVGSKPGTSTTSKTLLSFFKATNPEGGAAAAAGQGGATEKQQPLTPRAMSVTGAHGATFRVASASYPATLGVLQVWTHAAHRRRGVATALLHAARTHAVFGQVVPKDQFAFSQPTSAGHALASAFCERRDHLLYA